jgi:uncharacterized protein (DUF4415 family)
MATKPDPFLTDEDNPPLDDDFWENARPIMETPGGPETVAIMKEAAAEIEQRRKGRPPVEAPKRTFTVRLSADLIASIRATGRGYNARIEKVLRAALAKGRL